MISENTIIETLFTDFTVEETAIPVSFLRYDGNADTYVTYQQTDAAETLSGDDRLIGYVDYYDFDIFSKGNYFSVCEAIISRLESHGFVWQPSRSSGDMYEDETGLFHKTLSFAFPK